LRIHRKKGNEEAEMQKIYRGIVVIIALLCSASEAAQRPSSDPQELGAPIEVYEVVKGFSARVVRSENGHIREIYIQKMAYDGQSVQCSPKITPQDRERILDKIMRPEDRGEKSQWYELGQCAGGGCTTTYDFEHLKVSQTTCSGLTPNCQDVLIVRFPQSGISQ
jgi:hypothetical protein